MPLCRFGDFDEGGGRLRKPDAVSCRRRFMQFPDRSNTLRG
jgi:hypothetical protein